jgi:hypothetical protein
MPILSRGLRGAITIPRYDFSFPSPRQSFDLRRDTLLRKRRCEKPPHFSGVIYVIPATIPDRLIPSNTHSDVRMAQCTITLWSLSRRATIFGRRPIRRFNAKRADSGE